MGSLSVEDQSIEYWHNLAQHTGAQTSLHWLPLHFQKPQGQFSLSTPNGFLQDILGFCHKYNVGLYDLVYGAWAIVSNRHSGSSQTTSNFTVAGWHRSLSEADEETSSTDVEFPLVLKTQDDDIDVVSWIQHVGNASAEALSHSSVGYRRILESTALAEPQVKISVRRVHDDQKVSTEEGRFPLIIEILVDAELKISVRHNSNTDTLGVKVLSEHFLAALKQMVKRPNTALKDLDIMATTEEERLHQWGAAAVKEKSGLMHQLIEQKANLAPDAHALQFEQDRPLTFSTLNKLSNQLARQLRGLGETFVPVHMHVSANFIVTLLAILKAGSAYVILDPEAPISRKSHIKDDIKTDFVLVDESTAGDFDDELRIEDLLEQSKQQEESNLTTNLSDSDPAYIIYTSGSSGKPKAAVLSHHAAFNGLKSFPTIPGLRQLLFYNPVFSAAQRSIWATLSTGGCLCLVSKGNQTTHLAGAIKSMGVNSIDMTSTTAALLSPDEVPSLKRLVLGGEMANPTVIQNWGEKVELYSSYGLSECTQLNWRNRLLKDTDARHIGQPCDTTSSYIMIPETVQLSPILVPGELCLGGDQLAQGYLNLPELTEQKFIANPFGSGRLYRTGDRAIRRADGSIELLGRIDFQVKINGQS